MSRVIHARVTVIVPCFNYAHFLGEALDSVLAQTFADWECVVVDDGSTDDTRGVAEWYAEHDSRIRYLRQDNRGPAAARNHALRHSSAEYIQLLDADDRLTPQKLERHVAYLDEHPEIDVVYGPIRFFRTEDPESVLHSLRGKLSQPLTAKVSAADDPARKLMHYNITNPIGPLTRRRAIDRAGLFGETIRGGCEDWDLWLRLAIAGSRYQYVDYGDYVGLIRTHAASISRNSEQMIRSLIDAAHAFPKTPAAREWKGDTLPLIYEVALGIDDAEHGHRFRGARRMWRACRRGSETLTRIRWLVYAAAAIVLPRALFMRLVIVPMPEEGLEMIRHLRGRGTT